MPSFLPSLRKLKVSCVLAYAALILTLTGVLLPSAAGQGSATAQESDPLSQSTGAPPQLPQSQSPQGQPQAPASQPASNYDKAIFQKPIPRDQLAFLNSFDGTPADDLVRDKQFRKLMRGAIPDCTFHYGRDMPLADALEMVLNGSSLPVQIRNRRYLTVSGRSGPYLAGRGFVWIDLQDGIVLSGLFFHPTNGEPTPTATIFSKQVKEDSLKLSQLPPAFAQDLGQWSAYARIPPVLTRYFITGSNKKVVLEHDEDYCAPVAGTPAPPPAICGQMNADAADVDLIAAYYLEQTNHATNGTAWMITGADQIAWLKLRDDACRIDPDPLGCHIMMTREHARFIIRRNLVPHPPRR